MSAKSTARVHLTQRALTDLADIYDYSARQWGRKSAEKYLDDLDAGLQRIQQQPKLLQPLPDLPPALTFYRVHKHLFACDVQSDSIVVLTVIHACMDIPSRLGELQPMLSAEVEWLHRKLRRRR